MRDEKICLDAGILSPVRSCMARGCQGLPKVSRGFLIEQCVCFIFIQSSSGPKQDHGDSVNNVSGSELLGHMLCDFMRFLQKLFYLRQGCFRVCFLCVYFLLCNAFLRSETKSKDTLEESIDSSTIRAKPQRPLRSLACPKTSLALGTCE